MLVVNMLSLVKLTINKMSLGMLTVKILNAITIKVIMSSVAMLNGVAPLTIYLTVNVHSIISENDKNTQILKISRNASQS